MLLGRERERREIEAVLDGARAGRSAVLAVVGEPGIGKSALLEHAAGAAGDMRVLRAWGVPSEATIPFAGLFELLRPALDRLETIPRPQAEALETALALRPGRAENRFAVGAATLSLLASYAEDGPVAVLVDDAHWLDGSTSDALSFAARRLLAEPIGVLVAARLDEPSLVDGAGFPVLTVVGIDVDAAAALLGAEERALVERLHRETGGNPLALLELSAGPLPALVPEAPLPIVTSVANAFAQRAANLPERTRAALLLAAATDRGETALLARAAQDLDLTLADLDPAEATHLLRVDRGRIEFRHPLVRSAIYGAAGAEQRRATHLALAHALPDSDADRRAWHLALAATGYDDRASSALEQAGRGAHDRSAYDVASHAYERAAQLAESVERRAALLYRAADAAWLGGHADRALELLDGSARLVPSTQVESLRGHIALRRGPLRNAVAVALAAVDGADPDAAALMLAEAAEGSFYALDTRTLVECGRRARELASAHPSPRVAFFADVIDGIALIVAGGDEQGAAVIRRGSATFAASRELRDDVRLLSWSSMGPLWLREADTAVDPLLDAVATARDRAIVGVLPQLLTHAAIHDAVTNRWVEAQAGFEEAIALARETGQHVVLASALARLSWLQGRRGRSVSARVHAHEALGIARDGEIALYEVWSLASLVELELVAGELTAARSHVDELVAVITRHDLRDVDLFPGPELVEIHLRLDRPGEAAAAAEAFSRAAEAKGQPWARARAARARALLGDHAAFEEALDLHGQTADVFETARTRLAYGARLRRDGRRVRAREHLRAAHGVFERLGAAPWADRARSELAATGEIAHRHRPAGLEELTSQELQVALLLGDGKTTREAAAALFLSPKTVEYHLGNLYRRLGIHSRDELRAILDGAHGHD